MHLTIIEVIYAHYLWLSVCLFSLYLTQHFHFIALFDISMFDSLLCLSQAHCHNDELTISRVLLFFLFSSSFSTTITLSYTQTHTHTHSLSYIQIYIHSFLSLLVYELCSLFFVLALRYYSTLCIYV